MIQFKENAWTDGRTEGQKGRRMEGRTDRPYFIGPFRLLPGVQKGDKKIIKNYQPVSLLPICNKIFQIEDNKLLNCYQLGFWLSDSCVNHLLSITYKIYKSFDANPLLEVSSVFFIYLKPLIKFDMMAFFKLKLLEFVVDTTMLPFLKNGNQRAVLNGQSSKWSLVEADVPQGSILGPLLFYVYINDLPEGLCCNVKLFAGDT